MIFSVFHWYIRLRHWHVGSLMIDLIALLSTLTLILSWLLWSLHMHTLTPVYRLAWYVDSFACIVSWSSLGMTFVSLSIWLSYSCLPCVYMMIYLRFVWLCGAWLPSSAWLYASCLCGSHIYPPYLPLSSLGHFLHSGSRFCKCEALCVLVLWPR